MWASGLCEAVTNERSGGMGKNCDVTIRQAANGFVVEPRADKASSERMAAGWMVFDSLDRLNDWLRTHYGQPDAAGNTLAEEIERTAGFLEAPPSRWGRS